jgi:hypothetical protein
VTVKTRRGRNETRPGDPFPGARYPWLAASEDPARRTLEFAPVGVMRFEFPRLTPGAFNVYVAWSASDPAVALYVGRSEAVLMRLGQHLAQRAAWTADIGSVEVYEFASREAMVDGEIVLIDRHKPLHNAMVPDVRDGDFWSWRPRVTT